MDLVAKQKQIDNPYLHAREEWLERYGSYIARARQWRITAIVSLIITILCLVAISLLINQKKVVPYVVLMDDLGKTVAAGRIENLAATPQRVVQASIASVIECWRTVTVDTELQKRMIASLTAHTAGAAKGMLKEWYQSNNPYEIAKSGSLINVEITGLPLPVSNDSYRIEWLEIVRNHRGLELSHQGYEGIATVKTIPPADEEIILKNPGGVYVTNLSVSKIIK